MKTTAKAAAARKRFKAAITKAKQIRKKEGISWKAAVKKAFKK